MAAQIVKIPYTNVQRYEMYKSIATVRCEADLVKFITETANEILSQISSLSSPEKQKLASKILPEIKNVLLQEYVYKVTNLYERVMGLLSDEALDQVFQNPKPEHPTTAHQKFGAIETAALCAANLQESFGEELLEILKKRMIDLATPDKIAKILAEDDFKMGTG